jgi:hypothetical protein
MENGQERIEVEEDGQLKSVSINGEEWLHHEALAGSPSPEWLLLKSLVAGP